MLLVTTALHETWGKDEEILFLGEWCKTYKDKKIWEKRRYETLPYNWDNREQFFLDVKYLDELYEKILPKLGAKLNEIHKTNHSVKFWRISIGIWLGFFLQILFQRWISIDNATRDYPIKNTVLLSSEKDCQIPNDMADFSNLMLNDLWNYHIFCEILKFQKKINFQYIPSSLNFKKITFKEQKNRFKFGLNFFLIRISNLFYKLSTKKNDLFFIGTYLSLLDEIKLHFRFHQAPKYNKSEFLHEANVNKEMRQWTLDNHATSEFESFINAIIPLQLPAAYLEGYEFLNIKLNNLNWPKFPKLIFTSNSHIYDDLVKFWIASKVDEGSLYVLGQHGGGPLHFVNFQTAHELSTCDCYLSTGSGNNFHNKIIDVGQFFKKKWKHNSNGKGLLIQLVELRYFYNLISIPHSSDFTTYQNEQFQFMKLLRPDIRKDFIVRLNKGSNNLKNMWKDSFPDVTINDGEKSIYHLFSQSKLNVCTYAGTTYNESIAANAPTIIFWNAKYTQMHETSALFFEKLRCVGIFHDTPESAARHINAIWNNINFWWMSREVQEARISFAKQYCYPADNILDRIEHSMRGLIDTANRL